MYDITNKIRDTADRINGLERPKPKEGYALRNGISNKIVSQNKHTVNDSVENNLSKSDVKYSYAGEKTKNANKAKCRSRLIYSKLADFVDEYLKESMWKEFLNESELTERKINSTIEDVQAIYGEESVIRCVQGDSASFQTYEYSRKEGITGIENRGRNERWTSNGNVASKSNGNQQRNSERDISYSIENKNTAADLNESAFSLPNNDAKYSLPETESALKTENEKLKEDNKMERGHSNFSKIL